MKRLLAMLKVRKDYPNSRDDIILLQRAELKYKDLSLANFEGVVFKLTEQLGLLEEAIKNEGYSIEHQVGYSDQAIYLTRKVQA